MILPWKIDALQEQQSPSLCPPESCDFHNLSKLYRIELIAVFDRKWRPLIIETGISIKLNRLFDILFALCTFRLECTLYFIKVLCRLSYCHSFYTIYKSTKFVFKLGKYLLWMLIHVRIDKLRFGPYQPCLWGILFAKMYKIFSLNSFALIRTVWQY